MRPIAATWSDEELEQRLAAILTPGRRELWLRMARNPFTAGEIDAALDVLEDMTVRIERYLEASGGPWLFGRRLTLADLNVAPYVVRFDEERPGRLGRVVGPADTSAVMAGRGDRHLRGRQRAQRAGGHRRSGLGSGGARRHPRVSTSAPE